MRGAVVACLLAALAVAGRGERAADVERGRYLVHHVAHCVQCHTPRDDAGVLLGQELLQGAPVPLESPFPRIDWALRAPGIAGLAGWTDDDAESFLRTGVIPRLDRPARPPMPPFRMDERDARAVVAYLRSLR